MALAISWPHCSDITFISQSTAPGALHTTNCINSVRSGGGGSEIVARRLAEAAAEEEEEEEMKKKVPTSSRSSKTLCYVYCPREPGLATAL